MRVVTKSARKVEEGRGKEWREEPREIAQNDFTSRCRDVSQKKIMALESDPRL